MTPDAWFAATDPHPLLASLMIPPPVWVGDAWQSPLPQLPGVARRLRLFACACARTAWDFLPTDARSAVLISERFAEGKATESDLRAAAVRLVLGPVTYQQHAVNAAGRASLGDYVPNPYYGGPIDGMWSPGDAARSAAYAIATRAVGPAPPGRPTTPEWHAAWNRAYAAARATQADYARDIFPPPDYVPHLDPAWLTPTVVALARHADDSGDFSVVPILADALEDAGCDDETALRCCRAPGNVHVRGNWVVDLVLGGRSPLE